MKNRKQYISIFLVISLVASLFVMPAMAAETRKVTETIDLGSGVTAKKYEITGTYGTTAGNTITATSVEFKPGEYVPVVFADNAGWASRLSKHYKTATESYGYDVAAIMNGSFFGMSNSFLLSMYVSNGRVSCAHAGLTDNMVAFMPDGSIKTVQSSLSYRLLIDGVEVPSGLGYINKRSDAGKWTDKFYYYDSACGTKSDSGENGTELICRRTNNTELVIGGTMTAEVVEVHKDSKGNEFNLDDKRVSDYFALFVKNGSSLQKYADVKPGAVIEISVDETIEESREIMENASSVIANIGWLVKDGVDQTAIEDTIGTHEVTLCRGWTALGFKDDGSMILFVNDDKNGSATYNGVNNRLSMRDVAKNLLELGYTNVIRFDGGGSSALYVNNDGSGKPGYLAVSEDRPVTDTVMIVKKSSLEDAEYTAALKAAIDETAKTLETDTANEALKAAYDYAVSKYGDGHPTSGEVAQAFAVLSRVGSSTAELDKAILAAERITYTDYSEEELQKIYDAYKYAKAVRSTKNAASESILKAAADLNAAISLARENVASGKTYTGAAGRGGYAGNLTDGKIEGGDYDTKIWNGINAAQDGSVTLDLGQVYDINGVSTTINSWDDGCGIAAVSKITVEFSTDGKTFTKAAEVTDKERLGYKQKHFTVSIPEAEGQARYIRYTYSSEGSTYRTFIMVSEIEAYKGKPNVQKFGFANNFNTKILTGQASIFTSDFVTDFATADCNIKWSQTAFLEWDEAKQGYKIIGIKAPNNKEEGTLKEGQIAIAVHNAQFEGDTDGSTYNANYLAKGAIGQYIEFHGIYIDQKTIGAGAYFEVVSADDFDSNYNGILGEQNYEVKITGITDYITKGDMLIGVAPKTTLNQFKTHFDGEVTVEGMANTGYIGTGCKVTFDGVTYTAVVKGDVDGNGKVEPVDYVAVRLHILQANLLTGVKEAAAHVASELDANISVLDYVMMRLYILGKAQIK